MQNLTFGQDGGEAFIARRAQTSFFLIMALLYGRYASIWMDSEQKSLIANDVIALNATIGLTEACDTEHADAPGQ